MAMREAFLANWRLYLIEAWALGMFMISATFFVVLFYHPFFTFNAAITDPMLKRLLVGMAMGLTAVVLIDSPWGKKSGAHMNPAVTLAQVQLRSIKAEDALWYILFQTVGAFIPMLAGRVFFGAYVGHPNVDYIVTKPGLEGVWVAFLLEALLSFTLLATLLFVGLTRYNRYTGAVAGFLVCVFITLEAPQSGMSINPARSLGSALAANEWSSFWIYIVAPICGMQLAAFIYRLATRRSAFMLSK